MCNLICLFLWSVRVRIRFESLPLLSNKRYRHHLFASFEFRVRHDSLSRLIHCCCGRIRISYDPSTIWTRSQAVSLIFVKFCYGGSVYYVSISMHFQQHHFNDDLFIHWNSILFHFSLWIVRNRQCTYSIDSDQPFSKRNEETNTKRHKWFICIA